jgi:hypothetical protein
MGDPLSPAICIGTLAVFEKRWFDGLPECKRKHVRFTRYIDDIFMLANEKGLDNLEDFMKHFEKKCYPNSLCLERTPAEYFLECEVGIDLDNNLTIQHWNKNQESIETTGKQKYLKHQHFGSYTPTQTKKGALIGTWTRMEYNTNQDILLEHSIRGKMEELKLLHYPLKHVLRTLANMHTKLGRDVWCPTKYCTA